MCLLDFLNTFFQFFCSDTEDGARKSDPVHESSVGWINFSGHIPEEEGKKKEVHNLVHIKVNQWVDTDEDCLVVEKRVVDMVCIF